MKNIFVLTALYAVLAQCDDLVDGSTYAYFSSPKWWFSNYIWRLPTYLVAKNRHPDGTVSAPLGNSLPYVVRVNVSELAVGGKSNATDDNDDPIPNPYIVATTFDITYTGSASPLNGTYTAINGNSSAITGLMTVAYDYDFPHSVLNSYNPSKPGDCAGPLGASCTRALRERAISNFFGGLNIDASDCADVLGGLAKEAEDSSDAMSISNPVWVNATFQPFLWRASAAFTGRSQDALNEELGKMQLVGVTAEETDNETGKSNKVTSVLCFRVDVNAPTGSGMRVVPSLAVACGLAVLVTVACFL